MKYSHYSVLIYASAEKDLQEIKMYFESKLFTSPHNLFKKFYDKVELLEKNPFMFPLVKDEYLHSLGYRMIPVDNFLVFYMINEDQVQIHRFLYGKRNYLDILE